MTVYIYCVGYTRISIAWDIRVYLLRGIYAYIYWVGYTRIYIAWDIRVYLLRGIYAYIYCVGYTRISIAWDLRVYLLRGISAVIREINFTMNLQSVETAGCWMPCRQLFVICSTAMQYFSLRREGLSSMVNKISR